MNYFLSLSVVSTLCCHLLMVGRLSQTVIQYLGRGTDEVAGGYWVLPPQALHQRRLLF